jgi:PIN domain
MSKLQKNPELHVFLESSLSYSRDNRQLLSNPLAKAIKSLAPSHVPLRWHLPSIVKDERRYQMTQNARELIPAARKLHSILGSKIEITDEQIKSAVDGHIQRAISELGLIDAALQADQVDLNGLIAKSVAREPPFEQGETEKGFRDAIILESVLQNADRLMRADPTSRIVFLTNDKVLSEAFRQKTAGNERFLLVSSLEDMISHINAIPADLLDEDIQVIVKDAAKLFYVPDDKSGLFFSAKIRELIAERFPDAFTKTPRNVPSGCEVKIAGLTILPPVFLERIGVELTFSSQVVYYLQASPKNANTSMHVAGGAVVGPTFISGTPFSPSNIQFVGGPAISNSAGVFVYPSNSSSMVVYPSNSSGVVMYPSSGSVFSNSTATPTIQIASPSTVSISGAQTGTYFAQPVVAAGAFSCDIIWTTQLHGRELSSPKYKELRSPSLRWDGDD